MTPVGAVVLVVPAALLVALRTSDADFRAFYRTPRSLDAGDVWLFGLGAGALVLGALVALWLRPAGRGQVWPATTPARRAVLARAEPWLFGLTAAGYLLTAVVGAARGATPGLLLSAVTSGDNYTGELKTVFAPVAGVTTLTQVGIAYVVVATTLWPDGRRGRLARRLTVVLALGTVRAYLLTERLALLELVVPLLAIVALRLRQRPRGGAWVQGLPIAGVPALVVVFGAFEYSRSWVYFRDRTALSFPDFVVTRLAGYYATSANNGALQLAHRDPGRWPYDTVQGFWDAPGVAGSGLYERLSGESGGALLNRVLQQYGNPEFNNPGGLAVPFVDLGVAGGLLFLALAGLLVGLAHASWRSARPIGLMLYPVLFTGLLELPRYLYWTQGRVVPALLALLVVAAALRRADAVPGRRTGEPA